MSGIVGMYGSTDRTLLKEMLDKIAHRGPAGSCDYVDSTIAIAQNWGPSDSSARIDKPFENDDGTIRIIFDGFLTNRDELLVRTALDKTSRPECDARILLDMYEKYGLDFVSHLRGMFAFALQDGKKLVLARDPFGLKPLYLAHDKGQTVYFASEIKSLTFANNITTFPPGNFLAVNGGMIPMKFNQYFSTSGEMADMAAFDSVATHLKDMLASIISKNVCEGEKTGSLLSGGIDSSVITAHAAISHGSDDWHTFCVGTSDSEDVAYAAKAAKALGTAHHERVIEEAEVAKVLPSVIYHLESFDAPLVRSSIANYIAAQEAKKYVSALLCGEGGDELFAGYSQLKGMTPFELRVETSRMLSESHRTALQRDDRMTACHSIDNRVPFFDVSLVNFSLGMGQELKTLGGIEKYILRKSAESLLPSEVVWRKKQKFWSGSGVGDIAQKIAEAETTSADLKMAQKEHPDAGIKTREELFYFKIFKSHFPNNVIQSVGRTAHWSTR